MSTKENPAFFVVENTRRVTVQLADGVTQERLVELLNARRVELVGEQLCEDSTGQVLARRISSVNAGDYKIAPDQSPLPPFDTIDPWGLNYNLI